MWLMKNRNILSNLNQKSQSWLLILSSYSSLINPNNTLYIPSYMCTRSDKTESNVYRLYFVIVSNIPIVYNMCSYAELRRS